jgi:hypothetical protein
MSCSNRFVQEALISRGLSFIASFASHKKAEENQEAESVSEWGLTRREAAALAVEGSLTGAVIAFFGFNTPAVGQTTLSRPSDISAHVSGISKWTYAQINPHTFLAASHTGDPRIARWSVAYDNAERIMNHIQTGDIEMAKRGMDFFLTRKSIRKNGGWIVNVIDVATPDGMVLEGVAHLGPNVYLGLAALHLYVATGEIKYLNFARERWRLAKSLQNTDANSFSYGAVPMGPPGDPGKLTDQRVDQKATNPSWVNLYNAEHNADFQELSLGLFDVDKSSPDREAYRRAADSVEKWDEKILDKDLGLFYWGTTDLAYFDEDLGEQQPAGIVRSHPLDSTALKLSVYGVEGLDRLFGAGTAERIRASVEKNFKVNVMYTAPSGVQTSISGYDFMIASERARVVVAKRPDGSRTRGRGPLAWPEGAAWVGYGDLRFKQDYQRRGDTANTARYEASYLEIFQNLFKAGIVQNFPNVIPACR